METPQLPPQQQLTITTQSTNKTLLTTKQQDQLQIIVNRYPIRMDRFERCLERYNKKFRKLEKRFDVLIDEIDENTTSSNERFEILENKNIKEGLGLLDQNFSQSSDDDEISENSTEEKPLTFKEKLEQLEEKIEFFKNFFKQSLNAEESAKALQSTTIVNIQLEVGELTDDIKSLQEQTESLTTLKKDIKTITEQFAAFKKEYFKDQTRYSEDQELFLQLINTNKTEQSTAIKTELATFKKKYAEDQEELLQSSSNKNAYLESIILEQSQSISTLRRWLMAMCGGSAIALTIWLWHYIHNK